MNFMSFVPVTLISVINNIVPTSKSGGHYDGNDITTTATAITTITATDLRNGLSPSLGVLEYYVTVYVSFQNF